MIILTGQLSNTFLILILSSKHTLSVREIFFEMLLSVNKTFFLIYEDIKNISIDTMFL
jgi:hypothetical protein